MEDVGLIACLHLGIDVGIGSADLEIHVDLRIGILEIDPEVRLVVTGPIKHGEAAGLLGRWNLGRRNGVGGTAVGGTAVGGTAWVEQQ
jgi:hypothetical protein